MNAAFLMGVPLVVTRLAPIMQVKRYDLGPDKARERVRHGRHKGHSLVQGDTVNSKGYIK